jgi:hypothetical protein
MPLDVLVAGLVPPIDAPPEMRGLRLPALEKWLARAEIVRSEATTAGEWLASASALPSPPAFAAIALAADAAPAPGAWMSADPVHIRIERDRTSMHASAVLDVQVEEAAALLDALNRQFRDDGLEFVAPAPDRWYVKARPADIPTTTPLDEALGRDIQKLLPAARGAIKWPSVLTEIQMLLSTHDVNARRERERKPAINSVWLWGGGELPAHVASPYGFVHANDAFARGLATVAGKKIANAPGRLLEIGAQPVDWTLAVSGVLLRAIRRGDADEWCAAARKLDHDWFADLGETVARFGIVRLILPAPVGTLVATLSRRSRWRLFRPRRALAAYA